MCQWRVILHKVDEPVAQPILAGIFLCSIKQKMMHLREHAYGQRRCHHTCDADAIHVAHIDTGEFEGGRQRTRGKAALGFSASESLFIGGIQDSLSVDQSDS